MISMLVMVGGMELYCHIVTKDTSYRWRIAINASCNMKSRDRKEKEKRKCVCGCASETDVSISSMLSTTRERAKRVDGEGNNAHMDFWGLGSASTAGPARRRIPFSLVWTRIIVEQDY